jgi:hypothetical protein
MPFALGVVGGVGDVIVLGVGERDVADPALRSGRGWRDLLDRRPVLHPERERDLSFARDPACVGDGIGDGELVGRIVRDALDHVDQLVGKGAPLALVFGGYVDRHERNVEAACLRARIVEVMLVRQDREVVAPSCRE